MAVRNIIYVDNPALKGKGIEIKKESRRASRNKVIEYLICCPEIYRPGNIDTLNERVDDYKDHNEKLKDKMKELEVERKQTEGEFRKVIENITKQQEERMKQNDKRIEDLISNHKLELEKMRRDQGMSGSPQAGNSWPWLFLDQTQREQAEIMAKNAEIKERELQAQIQQERSKMLWNKFWE